MAHFHTGWFQNVLLCSSWDSLTPTLGLSGKLVRSIILETAKQNMSPRLWGVRGLVFKDHLISAFALSPLLSARGLSASGPER